MIPYLTIESRAELFGLGYLEQRELERTEPWVKRWPAHFDAAAAHLRAWLEAGRPPADRAALAIVGDDAIVGVARDVLARLPEPVAHWIVARAFVVCGGVQTRGYVTAMPLPPCDAPILVSLSIADPDVIGHEFAHAWDLEPLPASCRYTSQQREQVRHAFAAQDVEDGTVDLHVSRTMQRERAADALASMWLGHRVDTTGGAGGGAGGIGPQPFGPRPSRPDLPPEKPASEPASPPGVPASESVPIDPALTTRRSEYGITVYGDLYKE